MYNQPNNKSEGGSYSHLSAMDLLKGIGDKKKTHRAKKSGAKKDKKSLSDKKKRGLSTDRHNPRAFSVASAVSAKKQQQRNLDRAQQKEVVPLVSRAEDLPPPVMVVIMGPAGVGKTLLIRSLVKIYSGQNLVDTKGPVTVVAGKNRRLTFFECPTDDIYAMTDLAKVADLVLLMVDASYGYEMETFEFLNLLQLHGFPKVMGVLTHLDGFKANKTLQNAKKALKQRFWTEIYKGAKMFDFSGVVHGKYLKHEVKRLSLHISRVKFRPLIWRNSHPYVVADRVEDITSPKAITEDPKCNRDISLFGYVRGTHLKPSIRVHLMGAGDFDMDGVSALDDPCPMPSQTDKTSKKASLKNKDTLLYAPMANVGRVQMDRDGVYIEIRDVHYTKRDNLLVGEDKEGGDGSGIAHSVNTPAGILRSMQDMDVGVDERLDEAELQLFKGSAAVTSQQVEAAYGGHLDENEDDEDDEDEDDEDDEDDEGSDDEDDEDGGSDAEGALYEDDYDNDNDHGESLEELEGEGLGVGDSDLNWKTSMKERATVKFEERRRQAEASDLMSLIYGANWKTTDGLKVMSYGEDEDSDDNDSGDELFKVKSVSKQRKYDEMNALDSNRFRGEELLLKQWKEAVESIPSRKSAADAIDEDDDGGMEYSDDGEDEDAGNGDDETEDEDDFDDDGSDQSEEEVEDSGFVATLKERFVTGSWGKNGDSAMEGDNEEFGDFEDMQTGEVFGDSKAGNASDDEDEEHEAANELLDQELRDVNARKKASAKASFDASYDAKKLGSAEKVKPDEEEEEKILEVMKQRQEEQRNRNKAEFGDEGEQVRLQHEGVRQGVYVRIVIRGVPVEFVNNFDPNVPVILGGLLSQEVNMGLIRCRVKRHRWHKRVLKSNDPVIFSVGWRRFQSIPVYSMEDINTRERFLKYTPEHMHCHCTFYGPMIPPNTGILAYQKASRSTAGFRISMTGTALELQITPSIVKKLKLVGTPHKVFKNTAFITGMFNSSLEVAKFEGAKLKTVSGIRGQIKKAVKDGGDGAFRASFEDKILTSDLVICRLWVPVEVKRFFNPVMSLLTASAGGLNRSEVWQGLRTISQIRKDDKIPIPVNKDSLYKPIVRVRREFGKLLIPKKVEANLPFASKPKEMQPLNKKSYMAKRAVILEPEDRKKRAVVDMLSSIRAEKTAKRGVKQAQRLATFSKKKEAEAEKFEPLMKEQKKRKFAEKGKEELHRKKRRE